MQSIFPKVPIIEVFGIGPTAQFIPPMPIFFLHVIGLPLNLFSAFQPNFMLQPISFPHLHHQFLHVRALNLQVAANMFQSETKFISTHLTTLEAPLFQLVGPVSAQL